MEEVFVKCDFSCGNFTGFEGKKELQPLNLAAGLTTRTEEHCCGKEPLSLLRRQLPYKGEPLASRFWSYWMNKVF